MVLIFVAYILFCQKIFEVCSNKFRFTYAILVIIFFIVIITKKYCYVRKVSKIVILIKGVKFQTLNDLNCTYAFVIILF